MTETIQVLLVEDNPGDADLTRETLENHKLKSDIVVVTDGAAAVDYLFQRSPYESAEVPDLVLLDLNLPKLDGQAVLREMRAQESLRQVPVVVLTSSDAETDIVKSYRLGANCYVTKPVGAAAFQELVHAVKQFWFTVAKLP